MIIRPQYMDRLKTYRDVPLVKILAGIRRCGKSTILEMLRDDLLKNGIAAEHIISMRYTSEDFDDGMTDKAMYQGIKEQMTGDGRYYLLLDEVQEIDGWEKAVNSLLENADTDIYVTGSNSKLRSGEISTYLTGRYISIPVYPLSFAEYLDFKKQSSQSPKELLNEYIRMGGFPIVALGSFDQYSAYQIVEGIYNSVITNDITKRHNITNFELFNRVVKYIVENVGKTFSANAIVKFLKSEGRSLSVESVYNYLEWLEKAFVIYRCQRYDLQRKSVLKTQEKFYLADVSLKFCIMGFNPKSIAAMLENIVYFELRRRGYEVYIGKNETKEIDFVAVKRDERIYVQVCRRLPEESDREIANLLEIRDHYPKYVVTLDELAAGNINGVKIVHLSDFLLAADY
ncbi:ATP-binding protein [Murimonas intestini]|uniref:ATP-binding protein n=1 Tax=Murimonas intestini TaxID=1337051 RepID=A0AB73T207_9FIRM|nr:ATP-binding protein [Murimonas intestini]MCR1842692.1 ATP-binding protein [Murimonas intestini]MCR1867261.1 ATP-binding protein [Murimonas intestini]MCR1884447.1 ATP-binding protein [Murimonas intestini]